jgi:hypothetical protein
MARWRVRMEADASVVWTDPTGRVRTTLPEDRLRVEVPAWLDRARSGPTRGGDGDAHAANVVAETAKVVDETVVAALWSALEEELEHLLDHAARHGSRTGWAMTSPAGTLAHAGGRVGHERASPTMSSDGDPPF